MSKQIIIEGYSPQWPLHFQMLKSVYESHLGDLISDIQHVGSTSVVGLAAKPVIDIDLIIENINMLGPVTAKLEALNYEDMGDMGIKDREVFKRKSSRIPEGGSLHEWPMHNLYVCLNGSIALRNHLALRDFLRANPGKAKQYGELKKRLVAENPFDIDLYIKNKTPFIIDILQTIGFDKSMIDRIKKDNNAF
jgi:GrpB-like predicted nucleotidyltransferase (UPF0157 family)